MMFIGIAGWIRPEFRCLVRFLIILALIGLSYCQRPGVGVQPQAQFPQQQQGQFPQLQQSQFPQQQQAQFPQQQSRFQPQQLSQFGQQQQQQSLFGQQQQQQSQFGQQPQQQSQFGHQPQPQVPTTQQFQPRDLSQGTPTQFSQNSLVGPNNGTRPFQLSSNINLGRAGATQFSRYQIWFLASDVLTTLNETSRPEYVLTLQPPLQKGIPAHNISQVLFTGSTPPNPDVLKILIEQASGMLVSQQAVIIQRIRMRLGEPIILRTILSTERPFELFRFFNPPLLAKNMGTIVKTIKEMPEISRVGLKAVQVKLLPTNLLSAWLTWVRTTANVPRWTADDLSGKSFLGTAQQLNLAIMGLGCRDLGIVPAPEILAVLARYRQELYELRKTQRDIAFPLNLRNCALGKVVEFLKPRNVTVGGNQVNILSGLRPGEVSAIGGEILTAVPTPALENIPPEIRQEILQEIGRLEILDLFRLAPIDQLQWYANKFLSDLSTVRTNPLQPQLPGPQLTDTLSPVQGPSVPLEAMALQRMGNLLCYGSNILKMNVTQSVLREVLDTRTGEGTKTCCLSPDKQEQWATLLKQTYGTDTSKWTAADLVGAGDLLISLADGDLRMISTDALGKGVSQILRQSGFITPLDMFGHARPVSFITACTESLGSDGQHFVTSYKTLMRKMVEASQWMVNSVKTLDQVILDGAGRPRPRFTRSANPFPAYPSQPQAVSYWRLLRSPVYPSEGFSSQIYPVQSYPSQGYHSRSKRQAPAGPPEVNVSPNAPRPNAGFMPPVQTMPQGQPIPNAPPGMRIMLGQQPPRNPQPQQQAALRPPTAALPVRPGSNPSRPASNGPPPMQVQKDLIPLSSVALPASQPAPSVQALVKQFQNMQTTAIQQQQLPIRTGPSPMMIQNQNRPAMNNRPPPQNQNQGIQNPGFQNQNPAMQNQNLGFQRPGPQNPNAGVNGQNPNLGMQNPIVKPDFQNPNVGFPNQNIGFKNPNAGFQNPNTGFKNPNAGFQNPNAGFQNPNTGFQNPIGFQNSNIGFQNPNPGFQKPNAQRQNASGFPPNQQQGGRQPVPTAPQQFQNLQTRSQPEGINGSLANVNSTGSAAPALEEKVRSLPSDTSANNLTCMGIRAAGSAAIGLTQEDFDSLPAEELFDCIETLGNIQWEEGTKRSLLKLYKEKLNLTEIQLDTLNLLDLGTLVTALSASKKSGMSLFDDVQNIEESPQEKAHADSKNAFDISSLDLKLPNSLDTLSIMGIQVTEPETLKALADKFVEDNRNFPGVGRPDLLRVTVWSLGNIMCGFHETTVQAIFESDRSLFIDVSPMLGRLEGCSFETLTTLAQFAVLPSNYGPPQQWTREDVSTIGVVMAGLSPELFSTLTPDALEGLQPSAVRVIPTASLQSLSLDQLASISFEAAASIQSQNVEVLTHDQIAALNKVLSVQGDDFNIPPVSSTVLDVPSPDQVLETRALDNGTSSADPSGRTQDPGQPDETVLIFVPEPDDPSLGATDVLTDEATRSVNASDPHAAHANPENTSTTTTTTTPAPTTTEPPKMDEPAKETSGAISSTSSNLIYLVTLSLILYLNQL